MSKGGSQTQTTTQTLDPQIKAAFLGNLSQAQQVAAGLGPQQFAGFDPLYTQGEQMALSAGGAGQNALAQAAQAAQNAIGYQPQQIGYNAADVQSYYNPYEQQVVDQSLADIERQRQLASMNLGQQATAAKAFGGSRHGIAEGQLAGEYGRTAAQTAANLRNTGYQNALQMAMQQQAQNQAAGLAGAQFGLTAANQLGQLGQAQTAAGLQAAQTAMGLGATRQQFAQQQLDAARNLELQRLGITQGALGLMSPTMGASTSTTTPTSSNLAAGALGGAMLGSQIGVLGPYGALIGGGLGLLGAL